MRPIRSSSDARPGDGNSSSRARAMISGSRCRLDPVEAAMIARRLLVARGDRLDAAYLRRHAAGLGVSGRLEEAIRRAAG